jgi:hypothetical protein
LARKKKKPISMEDRKRSAKKPGERASSEVAASPPAAPAAAQEDLLAGADPVEGASPPSAGEEEDVVLITIDEDDVPVIDLDADTEDDAIERLIAAALVGAPRKGDEAEAEEPVIDLDAVEQDEPATEEPGAVEPAAEPMTAAPVGAPTPRDEKTPANAVRRSSELGPVSSPDVRDRLLAAALAHAEHQDARYRVPFSAAASAGLWKALAGSVILLLAGAAAVVPPGWATPEPPALLGRAEQARNARAALLLQAQQIEAFRVRAQRLPDTLGEVTGTLPGVRYVRSGTRAYQLVAYEANGNAIVYDSTNPAPAFAELAVGWAPPATAP